MRPLPRDARRLAAERRAAMTQAERDQEDRERAQFMAELLDGATQESPSVWRLDNDNLRRRGMLP